MDAVSVATGEHYIWGAVSDGWHLVRSPGLSVIEERMPPGATEQRHFHERSRQFFYVLTGELTIEAAGASYVLRAGHGLEIAPGTPHQALNIGGADVRFLVVSAPPGHTDRTPC